MMDSIPVDSADMIHSTHHEMSETIVRAESVSVIIPAYNEEAGISDVIRDIEAELEGTDLDYEVVVVDDGSSDLTATVAAAAGAKLLRHTSNRGYGAALKTGVRNSVYERVAIIDADGTYPVAYLGMLLRHNPDADMVVGSRTGDDVRIPMIRRPAKWVLNKLANGLTGFRIPDLNSGLRVFRKDSLLKLIHLLPDGFSFTTTITIAMLTNNFIVDYVPIDYRERVGKSKIRPIHDTLNFLSLIVRMILYFKPLQVMLPVASFLFLVDAVKIVYDILSYDWHIATSTILIGIVAFNTLLIGLIADMITTTRKSALLSD